MWKIEIFFMNYQNFVFVNNKIFKENRTMRYPNKKYEIPDGRELTVTILSDPINGSTIFHMEIGGGTVISFGFTGLELDKCDNQRPLQSDEFLLDTVAYPWAEDWFAENELAEATGEHRIWLEDSKYAFDTGNIDNWVQSANPNSEIRRKEYPVYRINLAKIKEGAV